MSDGKKSQVSQTAAAAGSAPASDGQAPAQELTISSVSDLSAQIEILRTNEASGPGFRSLSNKGGLKTTVALEGISNPLLMVLGAAVMRQLAINCGEDHKALKANFSLLQEYGKGVSTEIENELKLDKFAATASLLGISRNPGEPAIDFMNRVIAGAKKMELIKP